jgi:hypothetical protein
MDELGAVLAAVLRELGLRLDGTGGEAERAGERPVAAPSPRRRASVRGRRRARGEARAAAAEGR